MLKYKHVRGSWGRNPEKLKLFLADKVVIKAFLVQFVEPNILRQHFNLKNLVREHAHIHVRIDIK